MMNLCGRNQRHQCGDGFSSAGEADAIITAGVAEPGRQASVVKTALAEELARATAQHLARATAPAGGIRNSFSRLYARVAP